MSLQSTGPISFNAINVELDREATSTLSMNDVFFRELFERTSGSISLFDGYGKSNAFGLHTGITLTGVRSSPSGVGGTVAVFGDIMAAFKVVGVEEKVFVYNTTGMMNKLYELSIPSTYDDENDREQFGRSLAMNAEYLVVTAAYADPDDNRDAGIAFVYSTPTGVLLHTLYNPTPEHVRVGGFFGSTYYYDFFGTSVDISGTNIVIGAYQEAYGGGRSGAVYCFNAATGLPTGTIAHRGVQRNFGWQVGIDGDTVGVVGNQGFAELFSFSTGALLHTLTDTTSSLDHGQNNGTANLGGPIKISGDIVAVASSTYLRMVSLFSASNGNYLRTIHSLYNPTGTERNGFGASIALDGENLVIGSPNSNNPVTDTPNDIGMCHSYNANTGALVLTIENPNPNDDDLFGESLALADDRLVIGAESDVLNGAVYFYTLTN